MKLTKSIITEIKKIDNHMSTKYEMFYKVKYMDDTTKSYLLSSDEWSTALGWYTEWSNGFKENIHKEIHCVLLTNSKLNQSTHVDKYNVKKSVTDYGDDYVPQVF